MIAFVSLADYEALRESHKKLVEALESVDAFNAREMAVWGTSALPEYTHGLVKEALAAARKLDTPEGES